MTKKRRIKKTPKVFDEVCDFLGGDLDSPVCKEIKAHLESCPECSVYVDSIKRTVHLYKENDECLEAPEECKEKILKNILLESRKHKQ